MGLFKSKRREDEEFVMNYKPEDDMFIGENSSVTPPPSSQITKEEILGTDTPKETATSELSPLELLRKQMTENAKKSAADDDEKVTFVPGFKVSPESFYTETEKTDTVTEADASAAKETNVKETDAKEVSPKPSDTSVNTADVFAPKKSNIEDSDSVLQSCMPFILDGDEELKQKPAYTLESFNSILGLEEEKAPETDADLSKTSVIDSETLKALNSIPDISDIDGIEKAPLEQKTVTFDKIKPNPVRVGDDLLGESFVDISSGAPLTAKSDIKGENSDGDEKFSVPDDYKSIKDAKRIKVKLFKDRRSAFITYVISLLLLPVTLVFRFSSLYTENSVALTVISCLCGAIAVLLNYTLFSEIKTLFTKRASASLTVLAAEIASVAYTVFAIITKADATDIYNVILITVFMLTFRNASAYMKASYLFTNFVQIGNKRKKHVIKLIDDAPTTYAMSRHSIDGEILAAAPQEVNNATSFLSNSLCDYDFYGKVKLFLLCIIGVALLSGFGIGYYHANFSEGFNAFAVTMCIFASPLVTLCTVMPLKRTASRLNKYGAMLSSYTAAAKLEQANAVVFKCSSVFPKGSVNLYQMKVLSENDITDTIACAASITSYLDAPIAQVFNKIMETNPDIEIPESDSTKYEENMGITGWVDKKRIYIGNRSLMLAHEIEIPDISIDRKILKKGYFPIYLACGEKACALLAIRYTPLPDVAKELRRLSELGVTMLIDNCDQNITSEMLCDYFGLYSESVTIMNGSGINMYRNRVPKLENASADAAFGYKVSGFAAILTTANKIVKSVKSLRFMYFLTTVSTFILFIYMSVVNSTTILSAVTVTAFLFAGYILSYIVYLFSRP